MEKIIIFKGLGALYIAYSFHTCKFQKVPFSHQSIFGPCLVKTACFEFNSNKDNLYKLVLQEQ